MNIIKRMQAPTPKFFRIVRAVGIGLATAGGALLAAPIALPAALLSLAGYAAVAGGVITAVSQATTVNETPAAPEETADDSTKP